MFGVGDFSLVPGLTSPRLTGLGMVFWGKNWSWKVGHQAEVLTYRPTSLAGKWTMNENSYGTPYWRSEYFAASYISFSQKIFMAASFFFLGAANGQPYMISFLAMHKGVGRILEGIDWLQ